MTEERISYHRIFIILLKKKISLALSCLLNLIRLVSYHLGLLNFKEFFGLVFVMNPFYFTH